MSRTCSNCFQPLPEGVEVCPVCGYDSRKNVGKYPLALPEGTVLNGQYILGRVLGQGGFGITYVAQDHRNGNLVAVKEYFPDTMATRSQGYTVTAYTGQREDNFTYGKECFLNEAKTLAEFIGNPNIVRVYSYFEENNTAYFVMEYVQGTSFQDYLKDRGSIPWQEAKWILFPVMEALAAVHAKGIVHRDVTPDNIYITKKGEVKLLDFGAARYSLGDKSRSLDVVLKHGYAPKEQYSRHGRQGPYTDVYALGATFYFAITGRVPPDSIDRQDEDELILPSSLGIKIPVGVEDALCKALAVSAQDRFQSMGDFQQALLRGENEGTAPPFQPPQSSTDGGSSGFQSPQPPVGGGSSGSQPPRPPVGGGSSGSQPPQPPVGGGSSGSQPPQPPVGGGSSGFQPPQPPADGGSSCSQPSQPPAGHGDSDILSMLRALSPEKKKKIFTGVGALAALFVVIFAVVFANRDPESVLEVSSPSESSQASVASQTTSSGESSSQEEVTEMEQSENEVVERAVALTVNRTDYNSRGYITGTRVYEYDADDNLLTEVRSDEDVAFYKDEYQYNNAGEIVLYTSYGLDSSGILKADYWEEYLRGEEKMSMEVLRYDKDGDQSRRFECQLDANGNVLKKIAFDTAGKECGWEEYEYDEAGRMVREIWLDEGGNVNRMWEYTYDKDGNEIRKLSYDSSGEVNSMASWEAEYDSQGNIVRKRPLEGYEYRYTNSYDGAGRLLRVECYNVTEGDVLDYVEEYLWVDQQAGESGEDSQNSSVSSQDQSSQLEESAQSGEFTGSSHGLTGMKYAIEDIKSQKGFVDRYSGFPCGGLVDMEGGPWFLALYELETENSGYAVYYSLYDLRGNGLVVPACEELFVPVGGNNGKVGIYQDGNGTFYLMVEKREADGQKVYTSYSFTPITEDGLSLAGSSFASSEVNSEKGTGVYIVGDSKTDESGLKDFLGKYTPVCSMDLFGNYQGNVITFEDFVQNYT